MNTEHPILSAWSQLSGSIGVSLQSEVAEDLVRAGDEILRFLRRPDFAELDDESRAQFLGFVDSVVDVLLTRTRDTKEPSLLDAAIRLLEECYRLDSQKSGLFSFRLGGALGARYAIAKERTDLDRALVLLDEAVRMLPPASAERRLALRAFAASSYDRWQLSGEIADGVRSGDLLIEALIETPHEDALLEQTFGRLEDVTNRADDLKQVGKLWERLINLFPFRSAKQLEVRKRFRAAMAEWLSARKGPEPPTFLQLSRGRPIDNAIQEAAWLRSVPKEEELVTLDSYDAVLAHVQSLYEKWPGVFLVFRGQTSYYGGHLRPSIARSKDVKDLDEQLAWIIAVSDGLASPAPAKDDTLATPGERDPVGPAAMAVLQHYGARSQFIDVTSNLDVALWFAHHRFRMKPHLPGGTFDALFAVHHGFDQLPVFDVTWYERAWAHESTWGYLFILAPTAPAEGADAGHNDFVNLSIHPSTRMAAQQAGLVSCDPGRADEGVAIVSALKIRVPLKQLPSEIQDPDARRLFPGPDTDPVYSRILQSVPFCAPLDRPDLLTRRVRIPEYYTSDDPVSPDGWGQSDHWQAFRARDVYVDPSHVFKYFSDLRESQSSHCEFMGRRFVLSEAHAVRTMFPSRVILTDVPLQEPHLSVRGSQQIFLEYDPLSWRLPGEMGKWYLSQFLDRSGGMPEVFTKMVPLPGVRAAWALQVDGWFWCRVFAQDPNDDAGDSWTVTEGRPYRFEPGVGFVSEDAPSSDSLEEAIHKRAERAALLQIVGIVQQVNAGRWRLEAAPAMPYDALRAFPLGALTRPGI